MFLYGILTNQGVSQRFFSTQQICYYILIFLCGTISPNWIYQCQAFFNLSIVSPEETHSLYNSTHDIYIYILFLICYLLSPTYLYYKGQSNVNVILSKNFHPIKYFQRFLWLLLKSFFFAYVSILISYHNFSSANVVVLFEASSCFDSNLFHVLLFQELKNLRPQLYSAAEYCEKSYLHSEQKQM